MQPYNEREHERVHSVADVGRDVRSKLLQRSQEPLQFAQLLRWGPGGWLLSRPPTPTLGSLSLLRGDGGTSSPALGRGEGGASYPTLGRGEGGGPYPTLGKREGGAAYPTLGRGESEAPSLALGRGEGGAHSPALGEGPSFTSLISS